MLMRAHSHKLKKYKWGRALRKRTERVMYALISLTQAHVHSVPGYPECTILQ